MEESCPPEGLMVAHNVVPKASWEILERWLNDELVPRWLVDGEENQGEPSTCVKTERIPWKIGGENRRVAQFGFLYDYESGVVDTSQPDVPRIPQIVQKLLLNPEISATSQSFTQCIINWYEAETVIPWHTDHEDFGPIILVYTFLEERPLNLRLRQGGENEKKVVETYTACLRHCSRYILSGSSREDWEHSVPSGLARRISITFRSHRRK
jgi:alkylated DNA repair dioxygenase AlkB|mmetsp:Transcript_17709/g.32011  ORF Transcript_17709/g.32011 Transcript_17709/m.32011 type:complete len:211 (-) Transcript_17709:32-664(-)